ncbi:MAG TPA: metallophosphoesterase [Deltaproteobacteria bacterium]|nr:metallophosphoesterase [Deltaproteobacteria bacterium]
MTRIGVLSDTHLRGPDPLIETIAKTQFHDVDLIIHAGDITAASVLDPFHALGKEVLAVCGNMDEASVAHHYPSMRTILIENVTIGIIHGWGSPLGIRARIRGSFQDIDALVYGHSHQSFCGREDGIFYFNPGSPTDSRFTNTKSIGIMTITRGSIQGDIIGL